MDIAAILKSETPSMQKRRQISARMDKRKRKLPEIDPEQGVAGYIPKAQPYADKPVEIQPLQYPITDFIPPPSY